MSKLRKLVTYVKGVIYFLKNVPYIPTVKGAIYFLKNVPYIPINLENPLPVKDVLTKDSEEAPFDRANPHLISKEQLIGNDIDYQGDTLTITALSDVVGGTAQITHIRCSCRSAVPLAASFRAPYPCDYSPPFSSRTCSELQTARTGLRRGLAAGTLQLIGRVPKPCSRRDSRKAPSDSLNVVRLVETMEVSRSW